MQSSAVHHIFLLFITCISLCHAEQPNTFAQDASTPALKEADSEVDKEDRLKSMESTLDTIKNELTAMQQQTRYIDFCVRILLLIGTQYCLEKVFIRK